MLKMHGIDEIRTGDDKVSYKIISLAATRTTLVSGYIKGCWLTARDTGAIYINTGTETSATWTALTVP